jgi:putative RNA 2'-phosphotransferase
MPSDQKTMETYSKFLSLVLRHKPEQIGIRLDAEGWASLNELIRLANACGQPIDRTMIENIVASSDKKRFALSIDGQRIRANQGHSIEVALRLPPSVPPDTLFHGTASRFLESIFSGGLHPGNRQHVHLSVDSAVAEKVGSRHGHPVILLVDAKAMAVHGHVFYVSDNGVWLTESVPANYLSKLTQ